MNSLNEIGVNCLNGQTVPDMFEYNLLNNIRQYNQFLEDSMTLHHTAVKHNIVAFVASCTCITKDSGFKIEKLARISFF